MNIQKLNLEPKHIGCTVTIGLFLAAGIVASVAAAFFPSSTYHGLLLYGGLSTAAASLALAIVLSTYLKYRPLVVVSKTDTPESTTTPPTMAAVTTSSSPAPVQTPIETSSSMAPTSAPSSAPVAHSAPETPPAKTSTPVSSPAPVVQSAREVPPSKTSVPAPFLAPVAHSVPETPPAKTSTPVSSPAPVVQSAREVPPSKTSTPAPFLAPVAHSTPEATPAKTSTSISSPVSVAQRVPETPPAKTSTPAPFPVPVAESAPKATVVGTPATAPAKSVAKKLPSDPDLKNEERFAFFLDAVARKDVATKNACLQGWQKQFENNPSDIIPLYARFRNSQYNVELDEFLLTQFILKILPGHFAKIDQRIRENFENFLKNPSNHFQQAAWGFYQERALQKKPDLGDCFSEARFRHYAPAEYYYAQTLLRTDSSSEEQEEGIGIMQKLCNRVPPYPMAQRFLGVCSRMGSFGMMRDQEAAFKYIEAAANAGFSLAQYDMGLIFQKGTLGKSPNTDLALGWFQKAARQDLPSAMHELGLCYLEGRGVACDPQLAKAWFLKGSANGYAPSKDKYDDIESSKS